MEQIALRIGYLDEPFGSRAKREPHTAEVVDRFYMFRPGSDTYTSSGDVLHGTYPATFDIASLVGPRALPRLKLVWQAGNMPRQPLTFEAWAEGVYHDPTRAKRHAYHYDPAAAAKARATRERAEAAKAEAEEEAQEAKREAIRGQGRAALEEQQRKNRGVEAELKAARAEAAVAQRAAAIAQAAAHAAAAAAAAGGGADGNECCVCLLKPKEYMSESLGRGVSKVVTLGRGVSKVGRLVSRAPLFPPPASSGALLARVDVLQLREGHAHCAVPCVSRPPRPQQLEARLPQLRPQVVRRCVRQKQCLREDVCMSVPWLSARRAMAVLLPHRAILSQVHTTHARTSAPGTTTKP